MLSQPELEGLIRKTVAIYNRYRSPEAIAKLVQVSPENVTIAFSGSFCYSCGVLNYIEGFIHEFKRVTDKVDLKIGTTRQTSPRSFEVDYKIKSLRKESCPSLQQRTTISRHSNPLQQQNYREFYNVYLLKHINMFRLTFFETLVVARYLFS